MATTTLYERADGMPFFERLVGHFYAAVETDPIPGRSTRNPISARRNVA